MSYGQILVAVDLTEEATEVLAAARAVADENNSAVKSLTVVKPITVAYAGLNLTTMTDGSEVFEEEAIKQAREGLKDLSDAYGIAAEDTSVRLGAPAVEIRACAQEIGADLIVVGTHGRHGLGLLLGSTANAVLHGAQCDVLVVKIHPESAG